MPLILSNDIYTYNFDDNFIFLFFISSKTKHLPQKQQLPYSFLNKHRTALLLSSSHIFQIRRRRHVDQMDGGAMRVFVLRTTVPF